ncbi:hypothetical protein [Aeromicrobium sp.]|uniref:hypothetical protein n=1 Tax=Aeromicrobium sp. TaxID=1871063 RepID=UPI0030BBFACE
MSTRYGPSVTVACPAWCRLTPGHTYDVETAGGSLLRDHERRVAQHPTLTGFYVYIGQAETAASDVGPIHLEAPYVHVGTPEGGGIDLSGDEAADLGTWLAQALSAAVDELSIITSHTH